MSPSDSVSALALLSFTSGDRTALHRLELLLTAFTRWHHVAALLWQLELGCRYKPTAYGGVYRQLK